MQLIFSDHSQERRSTYQISRYPAALIDIWNLDNGARLLLRPVLPQDGALLSSMIQGLSRTTRRNRFHGAVNALSSDALRHMTCVDYRRHVAFVITTFQADRERVVADARFVIDERGDGAEFALVVDDQWQRLGLGVRAMQALGLAAQRQGLSWLHGCVLSANVPMLSLMQSCQFSCVADREDESLVRVERRLSVHQSMQNTVRKRNWPQRWFSAMRSATSPETQRLA
jgi:acetyltransferase